MCAVGLKIIYRDHTFDKIFPFPWQISTSFRTSRGLLAITTRVMMSVFKSP